MDLPVRVIHIAAVRVELFRSRYAKTLIWARISNSKAWTCPCSLPRDPQNRKQVVVAHVLLHNFSHLRQVLRPQMKAEIRLRLKFRFNKKLPNRALGS